MNKELLDIYSDYLISQNHYATATGLSDLLEGSISHDKVTRFLNKNHFGSKELWCYVKKHVRQSMRAMERQARGEYSEVVTGF